MITGVWRVFLFAWISQCFWKKRITNRFWIPVNFPKLLYRKLKLSGLSNISYMDKISTFLAYLFRRGTHEKVTLVKLAPESDFRLWYLEADSGVSTQRPLILTSKKSNEVPTSDPISTFTLLDRSTLRPECANLDPLVLGIRIRWHCCNLDCNNNRKVA